MLAIGLGEGALKYLEKKMDNPFVSFVNVTIPFDSPNDLEDLKELHHQNVSKDTSFTSFYGFKEPYPVFDNYVNFTNTEINIQGQYKSKTAKIRRAEDYDQLLKFIVELNQQEDISKNNNFDISGFGCLVSLDFLKNDKTKLTYTDINNVAYLKYTRDINQEERFFNIPIQGYVESFPDGVDVIVGQDFYDAIKDTDFWRSIILSDSNERYHTLQYYVIDDNTFKKYLIKNGFEKVSIDSDIKQNIIHTEGEMYQRSMMTTNEKNIFLSKVNLKQSYSQVFDFYSQSFIEPKQTFPEAFVFQFEEDRLADIEKFNDFLKEYTRYDNDKESLEIDMRVIESKKNFHLFKQLASLISVALIAFSILSLVLYITNLILSHISRNKKSLGTLKAFGLSNNNIIFIYSTISISMISISFLFGYFISNYAGTFLIRILGDKFGIIDVNYLNYVSYHMYQLAILFIVLPSIAICMKLWYQLRKSTPGDLIYER